MATAQTTALPAEFPPTSYTANQYVDSTGCAFIRAGISGAVTWVPRMTRGRDQLCGFEPSFAQAPAPEPVAEPLPIIALTPPASAAPPPVTAPAPAAAPVVAAAPAAPVVRAPRIAVGAPTTTVASLVTPPRIGARTPAPVVAPAPVAAPPAAAPAAPQPISQAQACAGLTGVQPNLINARNGNPIDCGPGPRVAAVAAPAVQAPAAVQMPQANRMTVAQACARMAETGRTLINSATGRPVACPTAPVAVPVAAPVVIASAPVPMAPSAPMQPAAPAAPMVAAAQCPGVTNVGGTDRYPVRCGPQALSPSGAVSPLSEPRVMARAPILGGAPVPASNPVGTVTAAAAPVPGFEPAWDDGRVNPNRGVPRQVAGAVVAQPQAARVSTRAAPQVVAPAPQATSHRFVQVGTYGDPANAQRAMARLQAMGLPVGTGQITRNGQVLQIVAAGPFGDAGSLQAALGAARSAGYSDAFTRR